MRVKILRNLGQGLPDYKEGEVRDVEQKEGEMLLEKRLAETTDEAVNAQPERHAKQGDPRGLTQQQRHEEPKHEPAKGEAHRHEPQKAEPQRHEAPPTNVPNPGDQKKKGS